MNGSFAPFFDEPLGVDAAVALAFPAVGAVVASTLAIAALFNPSRRRIQDFVDRRFYRRKYDAVQMRAEFSSKLRSKTDLDALSGDLIAVVR